MLPISATVIAIFRFIPTILIFAILRTVLGLPVGWELLWAIPIVVITIVFALGLAILISCINVYFRDIANFLPYLTRTFLYLSPVLWEASDLKPKLQTIEMINPLFPILDSWSRTVVHAQQPHLSSMLIASAWALLPFIFGTYFFYHERENLPSVSNTVHTSGEIAVSVQHLGLTYTTTIDRRPTLKSRLKSMGRGTKQTQVIRSR